MRNCAQMVVHEWLAETQPEYRERRLQAEDQTRESINSGQATRVTAKLITLPVVVHVVHQTAEQNISDAQVKSQIDALNRDYRAKNADARKVPPVLEEPRDRLEDPVRPGHQGPGRQGHDRHHAHGHHGRLLRSRRHGQGQEDRRRPALADRPLPEHLGLQPQQQPARLRAVPRGPGQDRRRGHPLQRVRNAGTGRCAPFNKGRTATHEVGHFLGLRHIWGDRNDCSGNDFVADTPPALQANTGKPTFPHITCNNGPSGDMFMNYMDYVDDDAMFMFTDGAGRADERDPGGSAQEAGRPLSRGDGRERADAVVGHWVHSHEEDTDAEMVYRPASYAFPPSRGRTSFDLRADGSYVERSPGPGRRPRRVEGLVVTGGRPAAARAPTATSPATPGRSTRSRAIG